MAIPAFRCIIKIIYGGNLSKTLKEDIKKNSTNIWVNKTILTH